MKKLWQKDWTLHRKVEAFETLGDLILDQKLVYFDVLGSLAHAMGLFKIGLLSKQELKRVTISLHRLLKLDKKGKFILQFGDEDIHTKIESYLTNSIGEVGKKIHTGRSRNDQILVALRLYTKTQMLEIWSEVLGLIEAYGDFAKLHEQVMWPGYTHMQKAMPSSVGLWAGSFVESLCDDLILLKSAYHLNDQSPLGSAAGYGVPLPLDRQFVADVLGFAKVQNNSLYCQNARGKIESAIIASLITILQSINKFAADVMWFTTSELHYFDIDPTLCSGSSIMPQKKNVDIAELLRSKVHLILGNYSQLASLSSNLVSGYHRDLQDSKKPLIESLELTLSSVQMATLLVKSIKINQDNIASALSSDLFATHFALKLVGQGLSFRNAYHQAATDYQYMDYKPISLKESTHLGGTGNLGLDQIQKTLKVEKKMHNSEVKKYDSAIKKLLSSKEVYEK